MRIFTLLIFTFLLACESTNSINEAEKIPVKKEPSTEEILPELVATGEHRVQITQELQGYFEAMKNNDQAATVEYFYPELFTHIPKENFLPKEEDQPANNVMKLDSFKIVKITDMVDVDGRQYAFAKFEFLIDMNLPKFDVKEYKKANPDADVDWDNFNPYDNMAISYIQQYGQDRVFYDRPNLHLQVVPRTTLYSIYDPTIGSWKFLEKSRKKRTQEIIEKIIPLNIRDKMNLAEIIQDEREEANG